LRFEFSLLASQISEKSVPWFWKELEDPSYAREYYALKQLLEDWKNACFPETGYHLTEQFEAGCAEGWETEMYNGMVTALEKAIRKVQQAD
jgi:hypothetical protein